MYEIHDIHLLFLGLWGYKSPLHMFSICVSVQDPAKILQLTWRSIQAEMSDPEIPVRFLFKDQLQ